MARRSMFVALTKSPTPPPVPNGPASAFEGPGGCLAGAFLHNQFMQGRPISGRHATTAGTRGARATPRRANGSPFRFRFPKKSGPPHFQNSVKASPLWFHFDVHRARLRTERTMANKCSWWVQARQMTAAATQRASSAMVRFVSMPHPAQT
jgi:hypothetical protein